MSWIMFAYIFDRIYGGKSTHRCRVSGCLHTIMHIHARAHVHARAHTMCMQMHTCARICVHAYNHNRRYSCHAALILRIKSRFKRLCACIYIYIYIYISSPPSLSVSLYIYIYIEREGGGGGGHNRLRLHSLSHYLVFPRPSLRRVLHAHSNRRLTIKAARIGAP